MSLLGSVAGGFGVTSFLVVGALFVVLVTGWFLRGKRGLPVRELEPAERKWYSREAVVILSNLAPLIMALRDREQSLAMVILSGEDPRMEVQEAMESVGCHALWSAFARASALVEEDPKRAVEQLRNLEPRLEERITSLDELLDERLALGTPVERGEGDGCA